MKVNSRLPGEREVGTEGKLLLLAKEDGFMDAVDVYNRSKVLYLFNIYIVNSLWKGRANSYLGHCGINIASNAYAYYGKGAFQKSELAGQTMLA